MWTKTENSNDVKPLAIEKSGNRVIVNRNFKLVKATEDIPAHYEYETWDMSEEAYEVYAHMETQVKEQADALIELADIIAEMEA